MNLDLRRTGAISAGLHGAVLLALLLTLKPATPPTQEESAVTMEFATAPGEVQRAQNPAPNPAPAPAEVPTPDLPSIEPPKPVPTEAPAPPPPPPLPPPPSPQAAPVPTPPIPPPPAQPSTPAAPVTVAPAPAPAAEAPLPLPPVPPPPPTPATPKPVPQVATPAAPKPDVRPPAARPAPERPTPTQRTTTSTTNQPNPTKNTAADSKTLDATLERLRSLQAQNQAPTRAYNPPRGGAPGGGSPNGVDNAKLSGADRGAIGDRIRECWTRDAGARDADKMSAVLQVVTDASGTVRDVKIVQPGSGPGGVAFAERARRAALDPQCNPIPLPKTLLGQTHTFEINFRP